ncbi:MAG: hypothetical protein HZB53_09295 [Chloroflexi bacterium]|nr:hypothetical protein [Chloroflexota bacterium]
MPDHRHASELDLHAESILQMEFEYARETVEQNLEDRRKVVEFYVVIAGALATLALALAQLDASRAPGISQTDSVIGVTGRLPSPVYAVIFWVVGLTGLFTLFHLIRLRQSFQDSLLTMNRIKDYYIKQYPLLSEALRWRNETMPPLNRVGSITFILSLFVVLVDSIGFGMGMLFVDARLSIPLPALGAIAGALAFGWQAIIYFWMLRE